jgi:tRNA A-37 threonylcarbamoyl transferase component Bud32
MSVLAPGSVVGETYRVIRAVGAGAMGQVYEATHARLAGRYAIKVMQPQIATHPGALERFRREAQITSSLRHPNIVHIMDFNQLPDGSPYLVMEFLEGLDLSGHLMRTGPPPLDEVVVLIGQIASALEAAHGRGVVHRDLKPQNVCLVPLPGQARSVVKVVDFGMSKIRTAGQPLTGERALVGTAAYMSPEQAIGQIDEIDARADQFSLGVMAYEMLSGRSAFSGDSEPALLYQVVHAEPAPLVLAHAATPSRRDALAAVVGRALAKDKNRRFASILEFALAFENASGMVRSAGRARAIFDSREGVAAAPGGPGMAPVAPTIIDVAPEALANVRMDPASAAPTEVMGAAFSPPSSARPWTAAIAGALIAGALIGAWSSTRWRSPPAEPTPVTVTPPAPTPPAPTAITPAKIEPVTIEPVTIEIEGLPAEAVVEWDQVPATPPLTLPRDSAPHHLRVQAAGFAPYEANVTPDRNRTIVLSLPPAVPRGKGRHRARGRATAAPADAIP